MGEEYVVVYCVHLVGFSDIVVWGLKDWAKGFTKSFEERIKENKADQLNP